jgi:hypothetical protein
MLGGNPFNRNVFDGGHGKPQGFVAGKYLFMKSQNIRDGTGKYLIGTIFTISAGIARLV